MEVKKERRTFDGSRLVVDKGFSHQLGVRSRWIGIVCFYEGANPFLGVLIERDLINRTEGKE